MPFSLRMLELGGWTIDFFVHEETGLEKGLSKLRFTAKQTLQVFFVGITLSYNISIPVLDIAAVLHWTIWHFSLLERTLACVIGDFEST